MIGPDSIPGADAQPLLFESCPEAPKLAPYPCWNCGMSCCAYRHRKLVHQDSQRSFSIHLGEQCTSRLGLVKRSGHPAGGQMA